MKEQEWNNGLMEYWIIDKTITPLIQQSITLFYMRQRRPCPEGIPVGREKPFNSPPNPEFSGLGVSYSLPYCIREGLGMGKKRLKTFILLLRAEAHVSLYESLF